MNSITIFAPTIKDGDVAQSVEQRTENPCVGGSIPSITTKRKSLDIYRRGFLFALHSHSASHSFVALLFQSENENENEENLASKIQFYFLP